MLEMVWKRRNKSLKLMVLSSQSQGIFSLASSLTVQPITWVTRIRFLSDLPGVVRGLKSVTCV